MHQLVEASKQGGEAHAAQIQTLQSELSEAKKVAAECKDAKVSPVEVHGAFNTHHSLAYHADPLTPLQWLIFVDNHDTWW